jgi:hypothetical protein
VQHYSCVGGFLPSLHEVFELLGKNEDVLADAGAEFEDVFGILPLEVCPRCVRRQVSFLRQSLPLLIEMGVDNLSVVQLLQACT